VPALAIDAALGSRIGEQAFITDVAAAVGADAVLARSDTLACRDDILHVPDILANLRGIDRGQGMKQGFIGGI